MKAKNSSKKKKDVRKKQPIVPFPKKAELVKLTKKQLAQQKKSHVEVIAQFHTLLKYMDSVRNDDKLDETTKNAKLKELQAEIDKMGGIEAYQDASIIGHSNKKTNKYNTGKWVIEMLKTYDLLPKKGEKLSLLDVGAITNHYLEYSKWLDLTAIDLNPRHPSVKKADFFELDLNDNTQKYDAIVLSLVLNCIGDVRKRGEMLIRCNMMLKDHGHLFLVLPLACFTNSRYLDFDLFAEICAALGFEQVMHKDSPKLSFFVLKRVKGVSLLDSSSVKPFPRRLVRGGADRNNFCIIIKGSSSGVDQSTMTTTTTTTKKRSALTREEQQEEENDISSAADEEDDDE